MKRKTDFKDKNIDYRLGYRDCMDDVMECFRRSCTDSSINPWSKYTRNFSYNAIQATSLIGDLITEQSIKITD